MQVTGDIVPALNADQKTSSNPIINIKNRVEDSEPVKDHRDYGLGVYFIPKICILVLVIMIDVKF